VRVTPFASERASRRRTRSLRLGRLVVWGAAFAALAWFADDARPSASTASRADREAAGAAPRHRSVLEGRPGYVIPPNPESLAVRRGRRDVPRIATPFTGGARSMEALGRAIVAAIDSGDSGGLRALCVTRDEFARILWPEMPQSAPASGATADDAWYFLEHRLHGGSHAAVQDQDGHRIGYAGIEARQPAMEFRNYRLIRGVRIAVFDSTAGAPDTLTVVRTLAERRGVWKIYSMRD